MQINNKVNISLYIKTNQIVYIFEIKIFNNYKIVKMKIKFQLKKHKYIKY